MAWAYNMSMRFARVIFLLAGVYGILIVVPEYFLETRYGRDFPPPINHPEFFYGFVGLCLTFQILFLVVASDPIRYRPIMLLGILEKLSFTIPAIVLWNQGRLPSIVAFFATTDLVWAVLFFLSFLWTPRGHLSRQ